MARRRGIWFAAMNRPCSPRGRSRTRPRSRPSWAPWPARQPFQTTATVPDKSLGSFKHPSAQGKGRYKDGLAAAGGRPGSITGEQQRRPTGITFTAGCSAEATWCCSARAGASLAHVNPLLKFPAGRRATASVAARQVRRRHRILVIRAAGVPQNRSSMDRRECAGCGPILPLPWIALLRVPVRARLGRPAAQRARRAHRAPGPLVAGLGAAEASGHHGERLSSSTGDLRCGVSWRTSSRSRPSASTSARTHPELARTELLRRRQ